MNYQPTQFVGRVAGSTTTASLNIVGNLQSILYEDSGDRILSGVVQTANGAKYNTNGTWQAASVPGAYRAVFLCRGSSMQMVNANAATLYSLNGASGTLYGVEFTATTQSTHTCSVVVTTVRPISMIDKTGAAIGKSHALQVEVVFEKMSDWM